MAVTTDPSKTGISETDALALTGTTLAPNVVNANLNSITPTGGTLAVTGSISATDKLTVSGGSYAATSNGNAHLYGSNQFGAVLYGQGTDNDLTIINSSGAGVLTVPTGSTAVSLSNVLTVGTNDTTAKVTAGGTNTNLTMAAVGASGGVSLDTNGSRRVFISAAGIVNISGLPTSSAGLTSGDLWNDGGTVKVA